VDQHILTLRVTATFVERIDKAIAHRSGGDLPIPTRSQAMREALAEWLARQSAA
jgi:hypothetical protein